MIQVNPSHVVLRITSSGIISCIDQVIIPKMKIPTIQEYPTQLLLMFFRFYIQPCTKLFMYGYPTQDIRDLLFPKSIFLLLAAACLCATSTGYGGDNPNACYEHRHDNPNISRKAKYMSFCYGALKPIFVIAEDLPWDYPISGIIHFSTTVPSHDKQLPILITSQTSIHGRVMYVPFQLLYDKTLWYIRTCQRNNSPQKLGI